jgi:two-component system, chemotaxis family, CheB/CheR fusion protein
MALALLHPPPVEPKPSGLRGTRILVVEDAADIREVLAILLASEGADVVTSARGADAVALAAEQKFDVVLTDLGLPDVPGEAVIRQLRALPSTRGVPVVVLTGYGEPFLTRARRAGANAVFTKPVEWLHVLEYLRQRPLSASA